MKRNPLTVCLAGGLLALAVTTTALADYKSTVLADNPAGYWRLDAVAPNSYATNYGSQGTVDNGVIANFTREGQPGIPGDTNTSMHFIGRNSQVIVPYDPYFNSLPFTVEFWMNAASIEGAPQCPIWSRSGNNGFIVYVQGDGSLQFLQWGGTAWMSVTTGPGRMTNLVNHWVHVACVFDSNNPGTNGNGVSLIYTNGVLAGTNDLPLGFVPNPSGALAIGSGNGNYYFSGLMGHVAIYGDALTSIQILAHYQAGVNSLAKTYRTTVLADNPLGYWPLGETTGFAITPTLAQNLGSLGAADNGTYDIGTSLQQPGALAGSSDTAAHFDGAHVMAAPAGPSAVASPFTVEFWTKPDVAYGGGTDQACPLSDADRDFGRSGWLFYQGGNGWSWYLGNTAAYTVTFDPVTPVTAGTWYHLVGTYDGTNAIFYINGAQVSTGAGAYSPNFSKPLTAGNRYDGSFPYSGTIDEIAIYPSVLSAGDVLAHYANGTNASPSQTYESLVMAKNPVSYFRLDETALPFMSVTNLGFTGPAVNGNFVGNLYVTNSTPLVGDSDLAMGFDAGGRISLPYSQWLNTTNAYSYEVWYMENVGASGYRCPLWFRDEPVLGDTRGWVHYLVNISDANNNLLGRGNVFQSSDMLTTWNGLNTTNEFSQGVWQHLVCTFDSTVDQKRIYVNGVLAAVSTNNPHVKQCQRAVETISSASYPFQGLLDEPAIYTNALSAAQVQAHYTAATHTAPPAVAASFFVPPQNLTNYVGAPIQMPVVVLGTPPFSYLWYKEGTTPLPTQTNATLFIASAQTNDIGNYSVQVSNSGGVSTSPSAYLDLLTSPPSVLTNPAPAIRLQGASATFTVVAGGSLPLVYQWYSNNVAIARATNDSLTLANIQPSFAAAYSVIVSNSLSHASAPSLAASLTVIPVKAGSFAATVVADMPLAYWRLDETNGTVAYDLAGGYNGTYDAGQPSPVAGAVLGDADLAQNFPGLGGGVEVPYAEALNPFTQGSVECWASVEPNYVLTPMTIFASRNNSSGWNFGYYLGVDNTNQWVFNTGHKTSGVLSLAGGSTTNAGWHHIVGTYDDNAGYYALYVDGNLVSSSYYQVGTYAPNFPWGTGGGAPPASDQGIATTTALDAYSPGPGLLFYGNLDEMALYGYPLSPAQVTQHYAVGTTPILSIRPAGSQVVVSWSQGLLLQSANVNGPWTTNTTAVSPWTNTPTASQQFFRALVP